MALIGKIRKNFWLVLILLGLALAAFVLMDMTSAGNRGGGVSSLKMGKINGTSITYDDFQRTETSYYGNNNSDPFAKKNSIWNFYVENALISAEADKLGLAVSQEELMDLQFGENLSPVVQTNWTNPQTRQVDRAQLNQFKTVIENGEEMNPQFRAYWAEQEKQIVKSRLQTKINNLVSKGIYTPKWLAEESFKEDNTKADISFVKIPFDNITNEVEVSDSDITAYLKENAIQYTNDEETRILEYQVFDVVPTAADSSSQYDAAAKVANNFRSSTNDSLFAISNGGGYANFYFKDSELPAVSKSKIQGMNVGDVYGPYTENNAFSMVKLIDKRIIPDTVSARHILRNVDRTNKTQLAEVQRFVDSLENLITRGVETFEELATKHSQDPGSGAKGGDLGQFGQGRMVPEFNDVCFITGKKGKMYSVVSQFGVHLIRIDDKLFRTQEPKYKIASIVKPIIPSEETQNAVYDVAAEIVSDFRDIESLRAANKNGTFVSSPAVDANSFTLGDLGSGQTPRDMIKWAFNPSTEINDIAPDVYSFSDKVNFYNNKYVVASLKSIEPAGLQSAAAARSTVETAVRNNLKAKALASELKVTSLADVASKYNVSVQDAADISIKGGFIPGVGNEPEVIGAAFGIPVQSISKPIVGSSGLFLVSPKSKSEAGTATNLPFVMNNTNQAIRQSITSGLIQSLKDGAKIEDERATFF